jgi:SAM-dependent methyltransferase
MDRSEQDESAARYSDRFFQATTKGSLLAARTILPRLWRLREFDAVVDVGCGVGAWLIVARELGATTVHGLDGAYVPEDQRLVEPAEFTAVDLGVTVDCRRRFDLCLCLEVAEHLHPLRGVGLVQDLTRLSSVIAFSAAIPYQGGDGHVNEMWPEYWASLFAAHGFRAWDGLRDEIWNCRDVPWWYRQNMLLFADAGTWDALLPGMEPASPDRLTRIHPESYLWNVRRSPPTFRTSYSLDIDEYYAARTGSASAPPGYGPEFPAPRPDSIQKR